MSALGVIEQKINNISFLGGIDMEENVMICNCKQVSKSDIAGALSNMAEFKDVLTAFEEVQFITHCSTGCGGCHDKVLDVISELMMG